MKKEDYDAMKANERTEIEKKNFDEVEAHIEDICSSTKVKMFESFKK